MKILLTGGGGFLARNLKPLFKQANYEVLAPSHAELDLLNRELLLEYLLKTQPEIIIHTASKGGRRTNPDTFEDVYIPNIKMFENLCLCRTPRVKLIIIGSGAEFDRRYPIQEREENSFNFYWPMDPYGLSKNIITRRTMGHFINIYVLRLFGCFNYDEDSTRFIKASILNLKQSLPIEIHQNKEMDFFYLDDVFTVMDYVLNTKKSPHNINLVYNKKLTLVDIASLIQKYIGKPEPAIKLNNALLGNPYTGSSNVLYNLPVASKLIGLEEGIRLTVNKLA